MIVEAQNLIQKGSDLSEKQMTSVMEEILTGKAATPQIVSFLLALILLVLGVSMPIYHYILLIACFIYLFTVSFMASILGSGFKEVFYFLALFLGCHLSWTMGFFLSPFKYTSNQNDTQKV